MNIKEDNIKNKAYNLILSYGITRFLNKEDLLTICEKNNWIVQTYEEGKDFIKSEGLEGFTIRKSFSFLKKETNINYIFYDNSAKKLEQTISIGHEIGHIVLEHPFIILTGVVSVDNWKEKEAERFAFELLYPTVIIKKLNFSKRELKKFFPLTQELYHYICEQISMESNMDINIEYEMTLLFDNYITKWSKHPISKKRKLKFLVIGISILGFCIYSVIYTISQQNLLASNKLIYKNVSSEQQKNIILEVVKTPTGERYHLPNCKYIKGKEIISMSIEKANQMGYAPCRICKPNELIP